MTTVFVYSGSGTYSGTAAYCWESPDAGNTHQFILFVAQDENRSRQDIAAQELQSFGFVDCEVSEGRPILVESLNEPRMQAFQKHYEGALAEGVSLVWYP